MLGFMARRLGMILPTFIGITLAAFSFIRFLPGDPVMGLRSLEDGYVPPVLDVSRLDRKVLVSNEESVAGLRALLDEEGIFAGVSSGAVVHVARRLAAELDEGVVVCVLADGGWKYLSAGFWEADDVGAAMERSVW